MFTTTNPNIGNYLRDEENEVLEIIFRWDKTLRILERSFNETFDLTLNQCRILLMIKDKSYIELSYLNKALNVDKSTTTRLVRPLLTNDYIEKFYQFGDKRKIYIRLSDRGIEKIVPIENRLNEISKSILKNIPAGKRDFTFMTVRDFLANIKL
ncbi:MAG: winged helix-turn-helix transcriptional regulator [Bacteroidetes bacterium]|nr:winged helix-turn-helix transcriptional regulator [Bacteroidota bacterium]MBP7478132.1 winged helix-turn-helix transcriptional regulator [Chitinophagales bacterium]